MAISATHFELLKLLKSRGALPQGGSILEIGQANWYGDADPREFAGDEKCPFKIARLLYGGLFEPREVISIDMDPAAPDSLKLDLNEPIDLGRTFDTAINHGTAEHIFDIAQVFKTIHDHTAVNGLMIHEAPMTGWFDHGFYNMNPTLLADLAHANRYAVDLIAVEHLASKSYFAVADFDYLLEIARMDRMPNNAMLFITMWKLHDAEFVKPIQGYYSGHASPLRKHQWSHAR